MNHRLSDLKATLVDLYETEEKAVALVDFIMDMDNVSTQGAPNEIWHSILKEASKQDKVQMIIDKALEDYPSNAELQALAALDWSSAAQTDDASVAEQDLTADITLENTLKKINNKLVRLATATVVFIGAIAAALNSIYDFTDSMCEKNQSLFFCPNADVAGPMTDINPILEQPPEQPPENPQEEPAIAVECKANQIERDNTCLDRIAIENDTVIFNNETGSQSFDLNEPETLEKFFGEIFITGIDSRAYHSDQSTAWEQAFDHLGIGGIMINVRNLRPSGIKPGKKVCSGGGEDCPDSDKVLESYSSKAIIEMIGRANQSRKQGVSIPRFIAADHEGGNVSQLMKRNLTSQIPSPMGLASLRNLDAVHKAANIAAEELQLLGVNMKLGPVVDINAEKKNRDIRDRSFGDDPDDVTTLARAEIIENEKHSIISVIKHYPGHGHTVEGFDTPNPAISYHVLATIKNSMAPFQQLKALSPAIMTSHMKIDSLDIENATTERSMIHDVLRKKEDTTINGFAFKGIAYPGLLMTDDLNEVSFTATKEQAKKIKVNGSLSCPEGVAENYLSSLKKNTLEAFKAGHDLLLFSHIFESDAPDTDYIKKSQDWCAGWATSLEEFAQIYNYLKDAIFPQTDNDQSLMRQNQLRETLKRIFRAKNRYLYSDIKPDANRLLQAKNTNRLCANKLLKNSITFIPEVDITPKLHSLKNLSAEHNVLFYSFINNKLDQILPKKIIQRLKYRYHRHIIRNLQDKAGHHTVLTLKKNPVIEESEHEVITQKILDHLSNTENPTHIIFYIDQYYQSWTTAQMAIQLIIDSQLVKPEYIHTIFARNPVVLFDTDTRTDRIKALTKTNLYIIYSAYEEGAKLQIDTLFASNDKAMPSNLPIKIQALNPVVSPIDTQAKYACE